MAIGLVKPLSRASTGRQQGLRGRGGDACVGKQLRGSLEMSLSTRRGIKLTMKASVDEVHREDNRRPCGAVQAQHLAPIQRLKRGAGK